MKIVEAERRYGHEPRKPYVPRDLCSYFWFVWSIFFMVPFAIATTPIWMFCQVVDWSFRFIVFVLLGMVSAVLFVYDEWVRKILPKRRPKTEKAQPNIFIAYLKARKSRICPLIEVVKD